MKISQWLPAIKKKKKIKLNECTGSSKLKEMEFKNKIFLIFQIRTW